MALKFENALKETCRACLREDVDMWFLHDNFKLIEDIDISLSHIISLCTSVQVLLDDTMPQYLCRVCAVNAKNSYEFRMKCEKSDQLLRAGLVKPKIKMEMTSKDNIEDKSNHEENYVETITFMHDNAVDEGNVKNRSQKEYRCNHCDAKFSKHASLRIHLKTNHLKEQHTCDLCGKYYRLRTSMMKHRLKHDMPPKPCPHCEASLATPLLFAKHMENEHSDLKNIKCVECGKTFFRESKLRLHQIMHSGVKQHTCETCGISFAHKGNLVVHRRLHTGENPYTCSHCGKRFKQHTALRSHEAGHVNKRDHVCPDCGAAFSRAGALRNHRKRHLSNRPFKCNTCGKAFTFSSERKSHMSVHTGVKNHVCELCGKRFNRNRTLRVHVRTHTGETPYVCHVCDRGFSQAHRLRTHMNKHKETKGESNLNNISVKTDEIG